MYGKDFRKAVLDKFQKTGKLRKTGRKFKISPTTVRNFSNYTPPEKETRGRKSILTDRDRAKIKRIINKLKRKKEKVTATKVLKELGVDVSTRTIQKELRKMNLTFKRIRQRVELTNMNCQNRKSFCIKVIRDNLDWKHVIFTDEARFSLSGPDNFRTWTGDGFEQHRVTKNMGRGGVMVWGFISYEGRFNVWRISSRLNAEKYSEFIVEKFLPVLNEMSEEMEKEYIFQQDNAGCHTARYTQRVFRRHNIQPMDWPARSPDLSPIENVWHLLKNLVYDGPQFDNDDQLWNRIKRCSSDLIRNNPDLLPNLYHGMSRRIGDCLAIEGKQIKK